MKTVDLQQKLKELYPNHRFVDKHSLVSLQFTADDMIEFAKQISDLTIDLCAYNAEIETHANGCRECGAWAVSQESILNTKTQIK